MSAFLPGLRRLSRLVCGVLGAASAAFVNPSMTLWSDLARATSLTHGSFPGTPDAAVMELLEYLRLFDRMRYLPDGTPESETSSGLFERNFRDRFKLSEEQYSTITDIYDRCDVRTAASAAEAAAVGGGAPTGVEFTPPRRRVFSADLTECCGRRLRVRWVSCTVYERDDIYSAWNCVKSCRHGCGTRYHFDRKIIRGSFGEESCSWHVYDAWKDGRVPAYMASKSGHAIDCTRFLTGVAITQAGNSRSGFQTQADLHNETVRRERGGDTMEDTVRLSGSVLLECFTLFGVLKHKQCRGPWFWVCLPGQSLVVDRPQQVSVLDIDGSLSGANHWVGLRTVMDEVLSELLDDGLWTRHTCEDCCQHVYVEGRWKQIRCVVADGLTAIKFKKCTIYNCRSDLPHGTTRRFCAYHEQLHAHKCAVTRPACPHPHQPGRLTCAHHSEWEDRYNAYYPAGGWHGRQAARASGNRPPPTDPLMKYLHSMFAARYAHGYLICTFSCGIVAGLAPLWESEGDAATSWALNDIWRSAAHTPHLLFYDRACFRRRYLGNHPDPLWDRTILLVDRWHYCGHTQLDCGEFCSPNRMDDPLLWRTDGDGRAVFRWNSSRAESTNAWLHGLWTSVKRMSRVLNRFILTTNTLVHNEILLSGTLRSKNPAFRV